VCCSKMVDATSYYELEVGLSCMVQKSGATSGILLEQFPTNLAMKLLFMTNVKFAGSWCSAACHLPDAPAAGFEVM